MPKLIGEQLCCVDRCGLIDAMDLAKASNTDSYHPFGGCNRLLDQYRQIGRSLLAYERLLGGALIPSQRLVRNFSAEVSFVPVEVLEAYLDDLLDVNVSDESLFIKKARLAKRAMALVAISVIALSCSLFVWEGDIPRAFLPPLLVITFLGGIGSAMYFLPRTKAIRRFSFATVLSREISSRRGHDRTDMGNFATRILMGDIWKIHERSARRGLPPHPARIAVRYYH